MKPVAKPVAGKKADSSSSSSDDEKVALPIKTPVNTPAPAKKRKDADEDEVPATPEGPTLKKAKNLNGDAAPVTAAAGSAGGDAVDTVFVGGLSYDASEADVAEFFKSCGEVKSCRIPLLDNGKSKGMAFVQFDSAESAAKAVAKNGEELFGRWLNIVLSNQQPKTPRKTE